MDLFESVVYPAFFEPRERSIKTSTYFFIDTQLVNLSEESDEQRNTDEVNRDNQEQIEEIPDLAILGRFVKDTRLTREQRYDYESNEIVPDEDTLQSSPTAIFILLLKTHRLLYFGETYYSPPIGSFEATIKSFLIESHSAFLQRLYDEQPSDSKSYDALEREYPFPTLRITPLSNQDNLRSFVERYSKLETVEIQISTTNAIDDTEFFHEWRSRKRDIRADKALLKYQNRETGLDKNEVIKETEDIISQADADIRFSGLDNDQNRLTGNLELLKLFVPMNITSHDAKEISKNAFRVYEQLIEQGKIAQARINRSLQKVSARITDICENMILEPNDDSEDDDEPPTA